MGVNKCRCVCVGIRMCVFVDVGVCRYTYVCVRRCRCVSVVVGVCVCIYICMRVYLPEMCNRFPTKYVQEARLKVNFINSLFRILPGGHLLMPLYSPRSTYPAHAMENHKNTVQKASVHLT